MYIIEIIKHKRESIKRKISLKNREYMSVEYTEIINRHLSHIGRYILKQLPRYLHSEGNKSRREEYRR